MDKNKFENYIDIHWWNNVEKRDLENWVRNFGASSTVANLILDNVIFYNASQLKAYTRFLIGILKNQVYRDVMKENHYLYTNDDVLFARWNEYLDKTRFVPAAHKSDPTSSAHKILGYWRSEIGKDEESFSAITDIDSMYKMGIRRFVLVDDFSGSGSQLQKVLNQKILFNGEDIEVGKLPGVVDDIEIMVAVYVIHEKAKKLLEEKYPQITLFYVDLINEDLNYLNEQSSIYHKLNTAQRQQIIHEIEGVTEKIMDSNKELSKLSTYVLNIPIVFEHGCPNNTLLLLFAHAENWQQLFKRGKEI